MAIGPAVVFPAESDVQLLDSLMSSADHCEDLKDPPAEGSAKLAASRDSDLRKPIPRIEVPNELKVSLSGLICRIPSCPCHITARDLTRQRHQQRAVDHLANEPELTGARLLKAASSSAVNILISLINL